MTEHEEVTISVSIYFVCETRQNEVSLANRTQGNTQLAYYLPSGEKIITFKLTRCERLGGQ